MKECTKVPTLAELAAHIGTEPDPDWVGKCFGIAMALAEIIPGATAVYGHYRGEVSPRCVVESYVSGHKSLGWNQHGWVLLPDGSIADPTRWVFEAKEPYIWRGYDNADLSDDEKICVCGCLRCEHSGSFFEGCDVCGEDCMDFAPDPYEPMNKGPVYDEGGNMWREQMARPKPGYDASEKQVTLDLPELEAMLLGSILDRPSTTVSFGELFWLANNSWEMYGDGAPAIFTAIKKAGHCGLVPIDNMNRAERENSAPAIP